MDLLGPLRYQLTPCVAGCIDQDFPDRCPLLEIVASKLSERSVLIFTTRFSLPLFSREADAFWSGLAFPLKAGSGQNPPVDSMSMMFAVPQQADCIKSPRAASMPRPRRRQHWAHHPGARRGDRAVAMAARNPRPLPSPVLRRGLGPSGFHRLRRPRPFAGGKPTYLNSNLPRRRQVTTTCALGCHCRAPPAGAVKWSGGDDAVWPLDRARPARTGRAPCRLRKVCQTCPTRKYGGDTGRGRTRLYPAALVPASPLTASRSGVP